jgi:predicted negative regulator of RcsB-dependent stress response
MDEALYIAFENYLNNGMQHQERLEFENQLENDAVIKEKFELYKETTRFLAVKFDPNTIDFKKNLETISREHFAETKSKPKIITFRPWQYAVAATVVIVFGILLTISGNPGYGDYSQHENAYFVERSTADENLKDAQNAFNNKDYQKAIVSFEKAPDLTSPEVQYYYAIALIETNHYKRAALYLNNIRSGNSVYKDKATWYLALSSLKQKKFDECKAYLGQIPADAEDYAKAQKLLKDLE